jgi:hypothetical protein
VAWWLAWGVFSLTGLFVLLRLRAIMLHVAVLLGAEGYAVGTVDKFGLIVLAILWIVFVALLEGSLRSALNKGRLGVRCVQVALVQAGIIALSFIVA